MLFDSVEASTSFSETFAKKKKWLYIRKPLEKFLKKIQS